MATQVKVPKRAPAPLWTERPDLMTMLGLDCRMVWVRADTLRRDRDYNRAIRAFRVEAITRKFNHEGLGVLYVSLREDGNLYIIDGQHRHQSILDLGMGDCQVPCIVYEKLTRAQERSIFLLLNRERLPLSAQEAFQTRAEAGENVAGALMDLLDGFGIRLVQGRQAGVREIASVKVLEEIDGRWGEEMVARVLALFESGWPEQPGIYRRSLMMAAASLLSDPETDDARLALALTGRTPAELEQMVLGKVKRANYSGWSKYADAMRELYAATGSE
jgi:hypothetical protein